MDNAKLSLDEIIRHQKQCSTNDLGKHLASMTLDEVVTILRSNPDALQIPAPAVAQGAESIQADLSRMSLDQIINLKKSTPVACSSSSSAATAPPNPCTSSLDQIINKKEASNGKRKCDEVEEASGTAAMDMDVAKLLMSLQSPTFSPSRALEHLMGGTGIIVEAYIGRRKDDLDDRDRTHLWQCILSCEDIKGDGKSLEVKADSMRKVVAKEVACKEFLLELGKKYTDIKIPKYTFYDELFIDPRVFHKLEKEACERAKEVCFEIHAKPVEIGVKRRVFYIYVCTYFVGTAKFKGEHFCVEYAKLLAAKAAYADLTGREFYPTEYYIGDDCKNSSEYNLEKLAVFSVLETPDSTLKTGKK